MHILSKLRQNLATPPLCPSLRKNSEILQTQRLDPAGKCEDSENTQRLSARVSGRADNVQWVWRQARAARSQRTHADTSPAPLCFLSVIFLPSFSSEPNNTQYHADGRTGCHASSRKGIFTSACLRMLLQDTAFIESAIDGTLRVMMEPALVLLMETHGDHRNLTDQLFSP